MQESESTARKGSRSSKEKRWESENLAFIWNPTQADAGILQ